MKMDVTEMGVKQKKIENGCLLMWLTWGETEDDRERMNMNELEVGMKQKKRE